MLKIWKVSNGQYTVSHKNKTKTIKLQNILNVDKMKYELRLVVSAYGNHIPKYALIELVRMCLKDLKADGYVVINDNDFRSVVLKAPDEDEDIIHLLKVCLEKP